MLRRSIPRLYETASKLAQESSSSLLSPDDSRKKDSFERETFCNTTQSKKLSTKNLNSETKNELQRKSNFEEDLVVTMKKDENPKINNQISPSKNVRETKILDISSFVPHDATTIYQLYSKNDVLTSNCTGSLPGAAGPASPTSQSKTSLKSKFFYNKKNLKIEFFFRFLQRKTTTAATF